MSTPTEQWSERDHLADLRERRTEARDRCGPTPMQLDNEPITICDKCLKASCWQGIWMCDEARTAGITRKPRAELIKLGREHPSYLKTDAEFAATPP